MHTILVADDSVTILKAVEIVFDKEPFQVVKAGSGAEAIARAKELRPHLVLTDHLMADKTGYEVAEALRADPATASIPVLILTGSSAPYDEGRAKAAGTRGWRGTAGPDRAGHRRAHRCGGGACARGA